MKSIKYIKIYNYIIRYYNILKIQKGYYRFMNFLNKTIVKNVLMSTIVLIIGGICSALGGWNYKGDKYFIIKLIFLIILGVIYIALLAYYSTMEVNLNKVNRLLKSQNNAFENIMIGISSICKQSASDINITIHNITKSGKIDLQIWSFDKASNWVCKEIYKLLCDLHGNSKEFAVGYIRLVEKEPENQIYMSAYANKNMQKPTIFGKYRNINDPHAYHDAELFQLNKSDIEIILENDKINEVFNYASNERQRKNRKKYTQYIGIPIFCDDKKMIGLLEIVCLKGTVLADTESELEELAAKYFVPYSYLTLLLHKLEKSLLAVPENFNNK